jgi:hypothetical protein
MECDSIEGVEEERVNAINKDQYNEGLALSILPEGYNYHFQSIVVISEIDENGELQIVIGGRTNVKTENDAKSFLTDLYDSCGSTFNVKSGRADRKGKDTLIWGHRKCIMQVQEKKDTKPKRKGLHQDCGAELNFKLENPKVTEQLF